MKKRTFFKIVLITSLSFIITAFFYIMLFGMVSYGIEEIDYKSIFQDLWDRSYPTTQVMSFIGSAIVVDAFKDDIKWYFYQVILYLGFKKDFRNKMIKFLWQ